MTGAVVVFAAVTTNKMIKTDNSDDGARSRRTAPFLLGDLPDSQGSIEIQSCRALAALIGSRAFYCAPAFIGVRS